MGARKAPTVGDKDVDAALRAFVSRLRRSFRVDRILLFGSRARGESLRSSDVDLVVVSPDFEGVGWIDRITAVAQLWEGPVQLEALCYTPGEFERRSEELSIVRVARKEGIRIA